MYYRVASQMIIPGLTFIVFLVLMGTIRKRCNSKLLNVGPIKILSAQTHMKVLLKSI